MDTIKITIDGKEVAVPEGVNVIQAARIAGIEVPHYCYHPKLSIAGNCRICLIEVEKMPKLQIGCNTFVRDGMVIFTNNEKINEARQSVLEFMLINHPIDCPVCDQAGECKLQQYYMHLDLKESRMKEEKVHKGKAIDLGPYVKLDQERCILCTRCVRFCQEVSKTNELCIAERGDHSEVTTFPGEELDNAYSLNTVDLCPVGALTSKDFRFQQRVWFLKETESVCPGCATGCNIRISHNNDKIYRLLPRQNHEVNECWMCDEGRMTYKLVNEKNRLRHPKIKTNGRLEVGRRKSAVQALQRLVEGVPGSSILGIGSALFTNEDNSAFQKFLKESVGVENFAYHANEVAKPIEDDFLISADKNPNRAGVEALGMKPLSEDRRYQVIIALGRISFDRLEKILLEKNRKVILFATHEVPEIEYADLVLPVATWAEQEGTFTNKKGDSQKILPAFSPPGEATTVVEWVSEIS